MVFAKKEELIFPMLGSPAAIGVARTLTCARLRRWDYSHLLDDALLIVTELVTNAADVTPGKKIVFQLTRDAEGIGFAVWDGSSRMPEPKPIVELTLEDLDLSEENFDNNSGWGLAIVQALSTSCGITHDPGGGKWIWARCATPVVPQAQDR
jgi:hypothetical protein